jgi:predicted extracellular nuclease
MPNHFLAFWNLENLFDVENSKDRPEWLQNQLKNYLKGWNQALLDKKLANQARIINGMNSGTGPDIIGFCEIENKKVVEALCAAMNKGGNKRKYDVVHLDSKDDRGIDIAFAFDTKIYSVSKKDIFSAAVMKRAATRDMLQVTFTVKKSKRQFIVIGNHWPARSAGQYESEPFRILVAETLSYWIQRIHEMKGEGMPVICMGDFNDEPFNRSLMEYALATDSLAKIQNARKPQISLGEKCRVPYLYNLMWKHRGENRGTFVYGGEKNLLDQFLVNRAVAIEHATTKFKAVATDILDHVTELVKGDYKTPKRFGKPSDDVDEKGFSDHLPITMILEEAD